MTAAFEGNPVPDEYLSRGGKPIPVISPWFRVYGVAPAVTERDIQGYLDDVAPIKNVCIARKDGVCVGFAWIELKFGFHVDIARRHLETLGYETLA
jgi:hypothetical protein